MAGPDIKSKTVDISNGGSNITIEHRVKSHSAGGHSVARSALLFGMKPMVAVVGLYALASTAAWGFLLPWGLSLQSEVDRLTAQIDRLDGEIDELTVQVNRYEEQNKILAENNEEYARQNKALNASNAEYERLNDRFEGNVVELGERVETLNASNVEYQALNAKLNETNRNLRTEVDELTELTDNLTLTALRYEELTNDLRSEVNDLEMANANLTANVDDLNSEISELQAENTRLSTLVSNLEKVTQFLKDEASQIQQTYDAVASFLAQQIDTSRQLVLQRMDLVFQQITTGWVCGFDLTFRGFPFNSNPNSAIGSTYYSMTVVSGGGDGYIEEEVLSELCLDADDFELYLANFVGTPGTIPPVSVTSNQLRSGVSNYAALAQDWYFPGVNSTSTATTNGLDMEVWTDAGYACQNLPLDKRYFWGPRN